MQHERSAPALNGQSSSVCVSIVTKGSIRAETVVAVLDLLAATPGAFLDIVNVPVPLEAARNEQILRFLSSPATHLYTVDSDCIPPPTALRQLLAHGKPIISSPHLARIAGEVGPMAVDRTEDGRYRQHHPMTGLQQVDAFGGSGILVEREAIERIGAPWFRFRYDERGLLSGGEDFFFCEKAIAAGYTLWADFDCIQGHLKEVLL